MDNRSIASIIAILLSILLPAIAANGDRIARIINKFIDRWK